MMIYLGHGKLATEEYFKFFLHTLNTSGPVKSLSILVG